MKSYRGVFVGVDVGGTFTDVVMIDGSSGRMRIGKTPSSREHPESSVIEAVRRTECDPDDVARFIHGTTVSTNTVIERDGAAVGLITTQGFEDILEIQNIDRQELYDLRWDKPRPLVPRRRRVGVQERVHADGSVLQPLSEESVIEAVGLLKGEQVEAIAICFLFSFVNPAHERQARATVEEIWPGIPVSISSEIANEMREYDRSSTVVIDAYVKPRMVDYIGELGASISDEGVLCELNVMKSSGGIMTAQDCTETPVHTLLSGPAAGVVAGEAVARGAGWNRAITLDMGGTSADAGLMSAGEAHFTTEHEIEWGIPIRVPMVDVRTIGAGGGSIAWIDEGGRLKVGPRSAGADPGPVCYGQGGQDPTVTDANLILGYLNPNYFAGGSLELRLDLAEDAVRSQIADQTGLSVAEAARGIVDIANVNMMHLLRRISVQEGHDPRDFCLVAFGGSGPVHSCDLARMMGIGTVLVPEIAGVLSAMGLLLGEPRYDFVQSFARRLGETSAMEVSKTLNQLADRGIELVQRAKYGDDVRTEFALDMRYERQNYHVSVEIDIGDLQDNAGLDVIEAAFTERYEQLYGYAMEDQPIELVNCRASVVASGYAWDGEPHADVRDGSMSDAMKGSRDAMFANGVGYEACPVFDRDRLPAGVKLPSPCIVEQADTTLVVPPGDRATVEESGTISISIRLP